MRTNPPSDGIIGWIEKDGLDGMTSLEEEVHLDDVILSDVVVNIDCNNWLYIIIYHVYKPFINH